MSFVKLLLVMFVYVTAFAFFLFGWYANAIGGDTDYATYLTSVAVFNLVGAIRMERSWIR